MDRKFICPAKLSRANWLGSDTYPDSFTIEADQVQTLVMLPPNVRFSCVSSGHNHRDSLRCAWKRLGNEPSNQVLYRVEVNVRTLFWSRRKRFRDGAAESSGM